VAATVTVVGTAAAVAVVEGTAAAVAVREATAGMGVGPMAVETAEAVEGWAAMRHRGSIRNAWEHPAPIEVGGQGRWG
jgi:hypothetical protein